MITWPYWIATIAFLSPLLGWIANRRYKQMPQIEQRQNKKDVKLPSVSIIIPARNEADNLNTLLPSLNRLEYPGSLEILVVNDNSTDKTAVVAHQYGARLLSLTQLPDGWLGKPNACHRGAAQSSGEWLLFTDADTDHSPHGLADVVHQVISKNLDGLSCHLQHKTTLLLDGLALTAAFAGLFAGLPRHDHSLNGQYILLRRDVYEQSGGFAAVRQESLEDLALGHHLNNLGYRVPMHHGNHIAAVTMYTTIRQLWQGMTRLGAGALSWSGIGNLLTVAFITALMTPFLVGLLVIIGYLPPLWFVLTWSIALLGILPWASRFGRPWEIYLTPFGALFVQLSAMWGLLQRLSGRGIIWKGRPV